MGTTQITQLWYPTPAQAERRVRELDTRVSDGLQVELLWCEADDLVFVRVEDQRTGEGFSVPVKQGQSPTDVFNHPFAYAPEKLAA
jgi:hypothetical protein